MSQMKSKKSFVSFEADKSLQDDFKEVADKYDLTRSFVLRQLMKIYIKADGKMDLIGNQNSDEK